METVVAIKKKEEKPLRQVSKYRLYETFRKDKSVEFWDQSKLGS